MKIKIRPIKPKCWPDANNGWPEECANGGTHEVEIQIVSFKNCGTWTVSNLDYEIVHDEEKTQRSSTLVDCIGDVPSKITIEF